MSYVRKIGDILNSVLGQSGFLKQAQFFGSPDPDNIQMTEIANRVAQEISGFYPWSKTRVAHEIVLNANQTVYGLPTDLKWIIPNSSWETDGSRKVDDNISDGLWYQYKFSSLTSGGVIRCRQYGHNLEVIEPFNGGRISFEYVTENQVLSVAGSAVNEFSNDDDKWLHDAQVLTLGIQAHWQQTKQMPTYQENMVNYMRKMNEAIGRDGARNTIGGAPNMIRRSPYTKLWVN